MLSIESLKARGADTRLGLSRCANNESLYLRLVEMTLQDLRSGTLEEALKAGDMEQSFAIAHKLKGGVNNLALDPISKPLGELTELLRNRTPGNYEALYAEILIKTNELAGN